MKTLYLLRHAHANEIAPPQMGDHERTLTALGTEEAISVGSFMQRHDMYPNFVLSSSAVRTVQTTRLIFDALFDRVGIRIAGSFTREIYQASAEKMLDQIQMTSPDIERLLLVAHNPGISRLAMLLSSDARFAAYAPAMLCVFKFDVDSWTDIRPENGKLEQVFVPGQP